MAKLTLEGLVEKLRAAFGGELHAVVLYGSAVGGDHVPRQSDYNVLVLVDALSVDRLQAASPVLRAWSDAGNPPPLTLTVEEWQRSVDIFPIEYADVLERHRVLYGLLPNEITIDPEHLRLELEHEAMGTLLQLRRGVLAAGGDAKEELALLVDSISTVMVIFRATLRLLGEAPPADTLAVCDRLTAAAQLDAAPFVRVIRHRRGIEKLRPADARAVLAAYLSGMGQLVHFLDALHKRVG